MLYYQFGRKKQSSVRVRVGGVSIHHLVFVRASSGGLVQTVQALRPSASRLPGDELLVLQPRLLLAGVLRRLRRGFFLGLSKLVCRGRISFRVFGVGEDVIHALAHRSLVLLHRLLQELREVRETVCGDPRAFPTFVCVDTVRTRHVRTGRSVVLDSELERRLCVYETPFGDD